MPKKNPNYKRVDWTPGIPSCPNKAEYMSPAFLADVHSYAAAALAGVPADNITLGKYGNSKIHAQGTNALTLVYSGLAHHDCPGATAACRASCYAMGWRFMDAHGKRKGTSWKYSYLAHHDIERLEAVVMREVSYAERRAARLGLPLAVRIHEAGDFVSPAHVSLWGRIADAYPHVVFWAYTRSDMACEITAAAIRLLADRPNMHVRASFDPVPDSAVAGCSGSVKLESLSRNGLPGAVVVGRKRAGIITGPKRVEGAVNCPEQVTGGRVGCADCGLCWHASRPVIRFYRH